MSYAVNQDNPRTPPALSIGMPVFNGESNIREALDSLLVQTFIDFELIISDNGSTDGTEMICREYAAKDPRIRYVRQSENRGMLFNFLFVLDEAQGKFFMWAAHDDIWAPNWVETMLQNGDTGILAFGRVVFIRPDGTVINEAPLMHCSRNLQLRSIQIVFNNKRRNQIIYGMFLANYLKKDIRVLLERLLMTYPDETYALLAIVQDNYVVCDERATFYKRQAGPPERKIIGFDLFVNYLYRYLVEPLRKIPYYLLYLGVPTTISVRLFIILSFPVFLGKWLAWTVSLYFGAALQFLRKIFKID